MLASPWVSGSLYRRKAMGLWAQIFMACCCSFISISCQHYEIRFSWFRFDCLPVIEHLSWAVCIWILNNHNCSPVYNLASAIYLWLMPPELRTGSSCLEPVYCSSFLFFEVEGFTHNGFVWTFERADLINPWDHLFLDCRHQIKLELLSTWFEVIDKGT